MSNSSNSAAIAQNCVLDEVSLTEIDNIIESRLPLGKFFCHTTKDPEQWIDDAGTHRFKEDEDLFIAVDNSSGDARTEEFSSFNEVKKWFK
jgi:hypothetical protein